MRAESCVFVLVTLLSQAVVRADDQKVATPQPQASSTATLPLEELLRLHRELDRAVPQPPEHAPVPAAFNRLELSGRLLDTSIEVKARIEIQVLSKDVWTEVPLLADDELTSISNLPAVNAGILVRRNGSLVFLSREAGTYSFELSFQKRARIEGRIRQVQIQFHPATLALLRLRYDEGMFRLVNRQGHTRDEATVIFPQKNAFVVQWQRTGALDRPAEVAVKRPPIESVITRAHASVVSTLAGRNVFRVQYQLRFDGNKPISFGLAAGQRLEKVYLNGSAVPYEVKDQKLALVVKPERAGDQSASLELTIYEEHEGFLLSGDLGFRLPRANWSLNELFVTLHLPEVFNYQWTGGSLAPAGASPDSRYSHRMPTPGKQLHFHQQLVYKAPDVKVGYTVDLAGKYFSGYRQAVDPARSVETHQPEYE